MTQKQMLQQIVNDAQLLMTKEICPTDLHKLEELTYALEGIRIDYIPSIERAH